MASFVVDCSIRSASAPPYLGAGVEIVESKGSASAQLAEINQRIVSAITGNGTVYFPPGAYLVDGVIEVADNIRIVGAGTRQSSIALAAGADCNLFEIDVDAVDFDLSYITLEGNKHVNATGSGIVFIDGVGDTYYGSGRCFGLRIVNFAEDGIHLGRHRQQGYWFGLISGDNGRYGINLGEDCQDHFFQTANLATNGESNIYVNGSNNMFVGGSSAVSKHLVVLGPNSSKELFSGMTMEVSTDHAVVINTSALDEVNNHIFGSCSFGRVDAVHRLFYSTTAKCLTVSGSVYKRPGDTSPDYLFELPSDCVLNIAGLLVQEGAYGVALLVP